jgi:hypothetical protein
MTVGVTAAVAAAEIDSRHLRRHFFTQASATDASSLERLFDMVPAVVIEACKAQRI